MRSKRLLIWAASVEALKIGLLICSEYGPLPSSFLPMVSIKRYGPVLVYGI